ncbi:MAG: hypothetical protein J5565_02950 [Muribaculaceae bacterium]|nr:hypothetical protein [Muribaculaceae bacterium]
MEPNMEIFSEERMSAAIESGQYPYMMQAVVVAVSLCKAWRADDQTREPYSVLQLAEYARLCDSQAPLVEGQYYVVTREGAIGLCPGQDYLTEWLFVPMEPCPQRDEMMRQLDAQIASLNTEYQSMMAQTGGNMNDPHKDYPSNN